MTKLIESAAEAREFFGNVRSEGRSIGFAPTMGALHEGHLSLVRAAKRGNDVSAVSVFVNPKQFGPSEDFDEYPRDAAADVEAAEGAGADVVFTPKALEIYPEGFSTFVEETCVSAPLCGALRPGHFRGVATVVARLLGIVRPDRLYLGRKDAQQLRLIEKIVDDLCLGVEVVGCPTVREPDGLAMSSRNRYLSAEEREAAPLIHRGLRAAEAAFDSGERRSEELVRIASDTLNCCPMFSLQYAEIRRWSDFAGIERVDARAVLALAVFLGSTRLIDNVILDPAS